MFRFSNFYVLTDESSMYLFPTGAIASCFHILHLHVFINILHGVTTLQKSLDDFNAECQTRKLWPWVGIELAALAKS